MPPIRIGLMGFGRIGRSLFRIIYDRPDIEVAAIRDVAEPEALEYLLRFDTIFGRFPDEVSVKDGYLYVAGRQIPLIAGKDQSDEVNWKELGADIVISATGKHRSREQLQTHLDNGAHRVILCSPPETPPDLTVVMGVNDDQLRPEHRIVSHSSCTAHCAAPVLKILNRAFGIERAFLSTVHAYSHQQRLADVPAKDPRRGRAAAENIIPQETKAAQLVMDIVPELAGKITGKAINVPVSNGSVVDLVCWHEKEVTRDAVNEVMRTAASTAQWRDIVEYEEEPIVSTDIVRTSYSSVFDSLATMALGGKISKTLSWYDNSWGYTHRLVDLIHKFGAIDQEGAS